MKFHGRVIPSGNATGVEIPEAVYRALGDGGRAPVVITINDHSWRSRVALMRGLRLIGISAANRLAAGIGEDQEIEVDLTLDCAPRIVDEPADLRKALDRHPQARQQFDRLAFGLRRKHVAGIEEARDAAMRERRIARLLAALDTKDSAR